MYAGFDNLVCYHLLTLQQHHWNKIMNGLIGCDITKHKLNIGLHPSWQISQPIKPFIILIYTNCIFLDSKMTVHVWWIHYKPFLTKDSRATLSCGLPDEAAPLFTNTSLTTSKLARTTARFRPMQIANMSPYLCARLSNVSRVSRPRKLNRLPIIDNGRGPGGISYEFSFLNKRQTASIPIVSVTNPICVQTSIPCTL